MGDDFVENPILEPFDFQLANGNNVKVVFAFFWERLSASDRQEGAVARKYFAIRIYSNENVLSNHLALQSELRADHEFRVSSVSAVWDWLKDFVDTRSHIDFEDLDDFVEALTQQLEGMLNEDAVEHYEELPAISDEEAFDRVDDSMFNDQNDGPPER